ncbi:MAG TPA: hypothetical protein VEI83_01485 [Acidimicrobiales bacterium]|nr:hypothetical protein [Acidimicrobiales bacterium]
MHTRLAKHICAAVLAIGVGSAAAAAPAFASTGSGTSAAAAAHRHYPPTPGIGIRLSVGVAVAGAGKLLVVLTGFSPHQPVVVFLPGDAHSAGSQPTVLTTLVAGPDGSATVPVSIPASVAPAAYEVVAQGIGTGIGTGAASNDPIGVSTLTVTKAAAPATSPAGVSLSGFRSPAGNGEVSAAVGAAALALGAAGIMLLTRRRRSVRLA